MNPVTAFLVGIALTSGTVFLALLYLRGPLQLILTDLCGSAVRARFWVAFSNLTLFLVPFAMALDHQPEVHSTDPAIFLIGDQLESAATGLVISVVFLGLALIWTVRRAEDSRPSGAAASGKERHAAAL